MTGVILVSHKDVRCHTCVCVCVFRFRFESADLRLCSVKSRFSFDWAASYLLPTRLGRTAVVEGTDKYVASSKSSSLVRGALPAMSTRP